MFYGGGGSDTKANGNSENNNIQNNNEGRDISSVNITEVENGEVEIVRVEIEGEDNQINPINQIKNFTGYFDLNINVYAKGSTIAKKGGKFEVKVPKKNWKFFREIGKLSEDRVSKGLGEKLEIFDPQFIFKKANAKTLKDSSRPDFYSEKLNLALEVKARSLPIGSEDKLTKFGLELKNQILKRNELNPDKTRILTQKIVIDQSHSFYKKDQMDENYIKDSLIKSIGDGIIKKSDIIIIRNLDDFNKIPELLKIN